MTHLAKYVTTMFSSATRSIFAVLAVWIGLAAPVPAYAQVMVTPQPQPVLVNRALYFDATGNLLHVEVVRNAAGRPIQPVPNNLVIAALPQNPPTVTPAAIVGPLATYAVYYGPDNHPQTGAIKVIARPLAFERLAPIDANRPIECATKGGDPCVYPRQCHCGGIGGCCCY